MTDQIIHHKLLAARSQINIRLNDITGRQIAELAAQRHISKTSIIAMAIAQLYQKEITMNTHWSDIFGNGMTAAAISNTCGGDVNIIAGWLAEQYDKLTADNPGSGYEAGRYDVDDFMRFARQIVRETKAVALQRIENTPELQAIRTEIFYDWPNWDEHLAWIATAPVAEIVDWAAQLEPEP